MANETDIIRGLVSQLSSVERDTDYGLHEPWPDEENTCQCALCVGRQYLAWREEPKVEDPASDQVDLSGVMP